MIIRAAIITLSDKGAAGQREDESGQIIRELIAGQGVSIVLSEILPDEKSRIIETLKRLSDSGNVDLILTTGGTGVAPRDVTPRPRSRLSTGSSRGWLKPCARKV